MWKHQRELLHMLIESSLLFSKKQAIKQKQCNNSKFFVKQYIKLFYVLYIINPWEQPVTSEVKLEWWLCLQENQGPRPFVIYTKSSLKVGKLLVTIKVLKLLTDRYSVLWKYLSILMRYLKNSDCLLSPIKLCLLWFEIFWYFLRWGLVSPN